MKTSRNFGAPKFRALYRQWLEDPTNTLWVAGSTTLADALDRDHGRVGCVELSRQYLHLSPEVRASAGDAQFEFDRHGSMRGWNDTRQTFKITGVSVTRRTERRHELAGGLRR